MRNFIGFLLINKKEENEERGEGRREIGREDERKIGSSIEQLHEKLQWLPHQTGTWCQIQTSKFNVTSHQGAPFMPGRNRKLPWVHLKLRNSAVIPKGMPDG